MSRPSRHPLLLLSAIMLLSASTVFSSLPGPGTASLVRGPYLQCATPGSAVVRWRTSTPTPSSVSLLGTSIGDLVFTDPVAKSEHEVALEGLTPDTEYFYTVGDGIEILAGGDQEHRFRTPPPIGSGKPTRIWVIGDSGRADDDARAVRQAYLDWSGDRETDVWLMLGDNAYESGTDGQYQDALFETYPTVLRNTFLWPTFGNHDARSAEADSESGVYYDIFTLPRQGEAGGVPSQTEAYYSFDHGDIHFICLDSTDSDRSPEGSMMTWLQADLASASADWTIAYFHHPPYSKGSHDSDDDRDSGGRMGDMREAALPILEAGGVDLVLTGHSHGYERSYLLDGHYGRSHTLTPQMTLDRGDGAETGDGAYAKPGISGHEGAVYAVVGSSASTGWGPMDHPAMAVSHLSLGSLVIDIDDNRLDARFLDETGVVIDEFTLLDGVHRSLTRDEPRISLSDGGTQTFFLDAGAEHAGKDYIVAGSLGTSPGFDLGPLHVPLNDDLWLQVSVLNQNGPVYPNTRGILDDTGRAQAAMVIPVLNEPGLVGQVFYHAFGVFDSSGFAMISNAVKLTLEH